MKTWLALIMVATLWLVSPTFAHRLDEYLQATTIAVEKDHVVLQLHLTPGVAVTRKVLAELDTNRDEAVTDAERKDYALRVSHDLSLKIDGEIPNLRLVASSFPQAAEMTKGTGDILLRFEASLESGKSAHKLSFENRHQSAISVYLVNCLVPHDPNTHILAQTRNYDQSIYQLDFSSGNTSQVSPSVDSGPERGISEERGLSETGGLAVVETFGWHGVRHILTGYDHLLFLSALVLAATTIWDLVKVVTAFTLAHSITLTLAALNLVHLPAGIVEPLIAASIVFVALQNIFWPGHAHGRNRLAVAFFFGLFHGLGFAGGLLDLMHQMPRGTVLLAILGFSIGVEAGNQMVVLPLFGFGKAVRHSQRDAKKRASASLALQKVGSAGVAVAGVYYLSLALRQAALF